MAESYSKSKLKRKKSFVENHKLDICSRGTLKRSHTAVLSRDCIAESGRSVNPTTVWWNREQLPAVESLWALTLKCALPDPERQHCGLVPDLPYPSTEGPTSLELEDQRWCNLGEEVAPFPGQSPPSQRTPLGPDPLSFSSSQQELSVRTEPSADPTHRQPCSQSRKCENGKTTSFQDVIKRPQPSHRSWDIVATSGVSSSDGGEEERKGVERGCESGPVNKQLLTNQVRVSDRPVSLQKKGENKKEAMKNREAEEVQRSVIGAGKAEGGGGGGGGLQSCPMCLLVFPAGFSQMDCDGHLAQCLSEVNVDVTW